MTPLFFSKTIRNTLLFGVFLLSALKLAANDSIPKIEFQQYCEKADAYFLYSFTDVTFAESYGKSYRRFVTVSNKLVVNNGTGVDKYAYLNLPESVSNNIYEFDVKTLKSDGATVVLDSSKVFERTSDNRKLGAISYPIPGVEPGDTIETSYTYTKYVRISEMTDFVNLYAGVPSMNTEYSIKSPPSLTLRYKAYNKFPKPQIVTNDSLIYCVFKMEKIKELKENQNTCLPCELPYIYYAMETVGKELRKWKDVYNQEFNVITQPISLDRQNATYYNKWKRNVIGQATDSSKFFKFGLLHSDIMENIRMEPIRKEELLKSSGFFLKEKRSNPHSIRRLYRQVLEDLGIEYWAVFARSKQAGRIDPQYIRKGEYDHIFFAYENAQGTISLLYPHEEYYKYQINEIPTSLYNTEAIIAKPYLTRKVKRKDRFINYDLELAEADSVTVNTVQLGGPKAQRNYVKQIFYGDVDLEKKAIPLKYKFSVSGGMFTDLKGFWGLLEQNDEVGIYYDALEEFEGKKELIQIDTITATQFKSQKPFVYTINAKGTLNGAVSILNDDIISISLDKLLLHNQVESDEDQTDLNYYLDYSYTDYMMAVFRFPQEVEVLDMNRYGATLKNEIGEYLFDLKVVDGNRVSLQSNYKISKDLITKEAYGQLKAINDLVNTIKNERIIVKLKKE